MHQNLRKSRKSQGVNPIFTINKKKSIRYNYVEKFCGICNPILTCKEAYVTFTGRYDIFFEVMVNALHELNKILFLRELSDIGGIGSTKTCVLLSSNTKYHKLPDI
jgi:hypothetical protein